VSSQAASSIRTIIGDNIRAARLRKGLTQRELASLIDAPDMHISRWERGVHRPSEAAMTALAEALGMSYAQFYEAVGPSRERLPC
jgi:transcriptional regulator with XRE-family HTH domain